MSRLPAGLHGVTTIFPERGCHSLIIVSNMLTGGIWPSRITAIFGAIHRSSPSTITPVPIPAALEPSLVSTQSLHHQRLETGSRQAFVDQPSKFSRLSISESLPVMC